MFQQYSATPLVGHPWLRAAGPRGLRPHTCHILPPSEIDFGLCLAVFTGSGGRYLFHRIGRKGRIWQLWANLPAGGSCATEARPISILRFRISEGLTQAASYFQWVKFPGPYGNVPESLSQQISIGIILVGRLAVRVLAGRRPVFLRPPRTPRIHTKGSRGKASVELPRIWARFSLQKSELARVAPPESQIRGVRVGHGASLAIVHYEYVALARKTSVLREAMLLFVEPWRFGASKQCSHIF